MQGSFRPFKMAWSPCRMSMQYTGGYWVHWGILSTLGNSLSTSGDTIISVADIMSTAGRCSVHWGVLWAHWGDTMMSVGDIMSTPVFPMTSQCTHDIPQCTEYPVVLMISPHCTHDIPPLFSCGGGGFVWGCCLQTFFCAYSLAWWWGSSIVLYWVSMVLWGGCMLACLLCWYFHFPSILFLDIFL